MLLRGMHACIPYLLNGGLVRLVIIFYCCNLVDNASELTFIHYNVKPEGRLIPWCWSTVEGDEVGE